MKALIRKELRENFKVTVLGLVFLSLMFLVAYKNFAWSIKNQNFTNDIQPLMNPGFVSSLSFFCALFGGVLGWLQVWNERHRDLWAFLVHRPLTRTQIFLGKSVAGLSLYLLMPGLPLLACVLWVAVPGHVPAPFEWQMALPIAGAFLTGVVWYFAGMLTGLRQARWYASRCLGLVAAMLVSTGVAEATDFWQALFYIMVSALTLGVAAWGAFHSEGCYEGQPITGKAALAVALGSGLAILVFIGTLMMIEGILRLPRSDESPHYFMRMDGAVYEQTGGVTKIVKQDVNGKPLPSDAGSWWHQANTVRIELPRPYAWPSRSSYLNSFRFFTSWHSTPSVVWYYWKRYGCLVGYSPATRRMVGNLGVNGFKPGLPDAAEHITYDATSFHRTLWTSNTVYEVADLEHPAMRQVFKTTGERILGCMDLFLHDTDWVYTVLVTDHSVLLLNPDGKVAWTQPFKPVRGHENRISVSKLDTAGQYAFWVPEDTGTNTWNAGTPPTRVTWFGREQGVIRTATLAALPWEEQRFNVRDKAVVTTVSPVVLVALPLLQGEGIRGITWIFMRRSLIVAVFCIPVVWWLGHRYRFGWGARIAWSLFMLLTGIPGLLAFFSVQEWPARERCPKCQKLRVVEREQCEHCGAAFSPPDKIGTEIFEPLDALAREQPKPAV
jgi:ABC-type transport system involved in multi-copper enzyme maturation permease subunit